MPPPPLDYATPASPQPRSRAGCFLPLAGGIWIFIILVTVPISADRYHAPLRLKYLITLGHLVAVGLMLYPIRGKTVRTWVTAILVSLFAAMQVWVLWFWN